MRRSHSETPVSVQPLASMITERRLDGEGEEGTEKTDRERVKEPASQPALHTKKPSKEVVPSSEKAGSRREEKPSAAAASGSELAESPRKKDKRANEKSEADDETVHSGEDRNNKKPSTPVKLCSEISRSVRTHLRASSESNHDSSRQPEEKGNGSSKNEKKDRPEKQEKKENVIVRLFAGSERHREKEKDHEREKESERKEATIKIDNCKHKSEVEVKVERIEFHTSGNQPRLSSPLSPMHKSGIRLIKVDSEACVTLPLYNSEITSQKSSSKAVPR